VLRLIVVCGNTVSIEIKYILLDHQIDQTRFFLSLAQRHVRQIGIPIRVPAQLQPSIQLAVMRQKHPLVIRADQPCRSGEVACWMSTHENLAVGMKKFSKRSCGIGISLFQSGILSQRVFKSLNGHRRNSPQHKGQTRILCGKASCTLTEAPLWLIDKLMYYDEYVVTLLNTGVCLYGEPPHAFQARQAARPDSCNR
jgi:hypothetical protein